MVWNRWFADGEQWNSDKTLFNNFCYIFAGGDRGSHILYPDFSICVIGGGTAETVSPSLYLFFPSDLTNIESQYQILSMYSMNTIHTYILPRLLYNMCNRGHWHKHVRRQYNCKLIFFHGAQKEEIQEIYKHKSFQNNLLCFCLIFPFWPLIRVIREIRVTLRSVEQHIGRTGWDKLQLREFRESYRILKKLFEKNSETNTSVFFIVLGQQNN